jgi:hypothetical protein
MEPSVVMPRAAFRFFDWNPAARSDYAGTHRMNEDERHGQNPFSLPSVE